MKLFLNLVWQFIELLLLPVGILVFVGLITWGIYLRSQGYVWWSGTGFEGKTVWNWMELFFVPLVLALAVVFFNREERKTERKIAENRTEEEILRNYLDNISELIVRYHLKETVGVVGRGGYSEIQDIAQVRTITTLRQLNIQRRNIVFQFLRDAGLANFILVHASMPEIDLARADLDGASLSGANLSEANLKSARLNRANFTGANLLLANLEGAYMSGANLSKANLGMAIMNQVDLSKANLSGTNLGVAVLCGASLCEADMSGVNLGMANLLNANLSRAKGITEEQISKAILKDTTMPDGSKRSSIQLKQG